MYFYLILNNVLNNIGNISTWRMDWEKETHTLGEVEWYSSKTKGGMGALICGDEFEQTLTLWMRVLPTLFHLKITALMECVEENFELGYRDKGISIYSNSQDALKALDWKKLGQS